MTQTQLDRYAELLFRCIGGPAGRKVLVIAEPVYREFAVQVAGKVYRQGAALVVIDYAEPPAGWQLTRPYLSTSSSGTLIQGVWFEFEDGAVVGFCADEGEGVLAAVLRMDEQAKYFGEIALVDSQSAVAQAGLTFFNTLYDENAATHMALGRGFPRFVDGADGMTAAELVAAGVNQSLMRSGSFVV